MDCPICKLPERDVSTHAVGDRYEVTCARCGRFVISGTAVAITAVRPADFRLSAWTRMKDGVAEPPVITPAMLESSTEDLPKYGVTEKQLLFLRSLERQSDFAGKRVHVVPEFDFSLAACSSAKELEYIIRALMGRGYVTLEDHADPRDSFSLELTVTPSGWSFLEGGAGMAQPQRVEETQTASASKVHAPWDVFVSHASEDKETFARPLADALRARGLNVWFDAFTLTVGDSLRKSIDRGLAQSRFGIVILSDFFFQKHWPQVELDGLAARESSGAKVILPVWHGVNQQRVCSYSPLLADRLAVSSALGIEHVVHELMQAMQAPSRGTAA